MDRYGRRHDYLRVSLTDRCNLRCLYCMPAEGVQWREKAEILTLEEIEQLVRVFVEHGVRKVRLTGGEPSVRKGYIGLVQRLAGIPGLEQLGLTTNGLTLAYDAHALKAAGLDSVNVSLDTLSPDRFFQLARRPGHHRVLAGIRAAVESGLTTKVNVVVLAGTNDDEVLDFVGLTRDWPVTVRFIEFMPFLGNNWQPDRVIPSAEIRERVSRAFPTRPVARQASDVASELDIEGHAGKVGFVSSVSESFCGDCNRLRLTADGQLKCCLFLSPDGNLRDALRAGASGDKLAAIAQNCLDHKWRAHPDMSDWQQRDVLPMVQIGG